MTLLVVPEEVNQAKKPSHFAGKLFSDGNHVSPKGLQIEDKGS